MTIKTNAKYTLATIYYRLGDLDIALKLYNNVKYEYEKRRDDRGFAVVLHAIGIIHQDQGNYEEALNLYNQSLKIHRELGNKEEIAISLRALENLKEEIGEEKFKALLEKCRAQKG